MGNLNNKANVKITISNSADIYTLIVEDEIHKGYNLFIDVSGERLKITVISLQNDRTYMTTLKLDDLKKMTMFSADETLDCIKKHIESYVKLKGLKIDESENKILLTFISHKFGAVTINLPFNNSTKKQCNTTTMENPLLENLILSDNIDLTHNEWFKIIISLYNKGKYEDTLKIIGEQETTVIYLYFKGLCKFKLGDYVGALTSFIALGCHNHVDISSYVEKYIEFLKGKEDQLYRESLRVSSLQQKIELLNKAIQINPNYGIAYNEKGVVSLEMGEYNEAIVCFTKAIGLNLRTATVYNNIGKALIKLNKPIEAIENFSKAIELDSMYDEAYYNKGLALLKDLKFEEAIKCFDKVITINPLHKTVYTEKGFALQKLQKFLEASECYNKAIELDPKSSVAYYAKGFCLRHLNRFEEAVECFNKCIEIDPSKCTNHNNKGHALANLKKYDESLNCFNKSLEIDSSNHTALINKGYALTFLKRYNEALECYNMALALKQDDNVYYNKG
jgi:tetratricopeptide (TPR) repeat protein